MPWALLSPALVIAIVFFGIPMLLMLRMSFNEHAPQRLYVPGFTLRHYAQLLTEERFINAIWTTVKLSLLASLATLVIGYAFALLVWLKPTRWRLAFIGLALTPLLISEISIIFGWWMFFPKNGLLSFALTSAGVLSDKISLMYTEFAAFVGLIYITLPFCFFILLSIFDAIDRRLIEASGDLGARPIDYLLRSVAAADADRHSGRLRPVVHLGHGHLCYALGPRARTRCGPSAT